MFETIGPHSSASALLLLLSCASQSIAYTKAFEYDQNGNLETVIDPLEREVASCLYDGYGQLTSVTNTLNKTVTLDYDTHGNIVEATSPLNKTSSARVRRLRVN